MQTKTVDLSQGLVAIVDESDYALVSSHTWAAHRDHHRERWYAVTTIRVHGEKKQIQMHRMILEAPSGLKVDHRDGDGLNNRRSNIRLATNKQNQWNRGVGIRNKSGFRGVCWHKRDSCWQAAIRVDGRIKHLGYFLDVTQASRAYEQAALLHHGEFYREAAV